MANPEQLKRLEQGVDAWNRWRDAHPSEAVDLSEAFLMRADLRGANFSKAKLTKANLFESRLGAANLYEADLADADLSWARFEGANLERATLSRAVLRHTFLMDANLAHGSLTFADLSSANLMRANLSGANLSSAILYRADLTLANVKGTTLTDASLAFATFHETNCSGADLRKCSLFMARCVQTDFTNADISGALVYGISVWDVRLFGTTQTNLVITGKDQPTITVDNLEVAQFIYLLLSNDKIRKVIDGITSKLVLILGRFTKERKEVLEVLRDTLRTKNYSPVVFDFEKPASRNLTETIRILAGMARFVIADITDARSIPHELMAIVPDLPSVPVQPLLLSSQHEYGMFEHFRRYPWVLKETLYQNPEHLVSNIDSSITPAELWLKEMQERV